jgi:transcriptional regulator with XRE-family HTH domain
MNKISPNLTDLAIVLEIGRRLEEIRLEKNISHETLALELGVTRVTLARILSGKGTLLNTIRVMRELDLLENLNQLTPISEISPMQLLKNRGHSRKRASTKRKLEENKIKGPDW